MATATRTFPTIEKKQEICNKASEIAERLGTKTADSVGRRELKFEFMDYLYAKGNLEIIFSRIITHSAGRSETMKQFVTRDIPTADYLVINYNGKEVLSADMNPMQNKIVNVLIFVGGEWEGIIEKLHEKLKNNRGKIRLPPNPPDSSVG